MKKFEELDQPIQEQIKSVLRAYDECNVIFENGEYSVSPHTCIKAKYGADHEVIGYYKATEVFTTDERIVNYIEGFMSYPREYKGNQDWTMIKKLEEYRHEMKQGKIKLDENGNAIIYDVVDIKSYSSK